MPVGSLSISWFTEKLKTLQMKSETKIIQDVQFKRISVPTQPLTVVISWISVCMSSIFAHMFNP